MKILAIESSCDDTSAAVVRDGRCVLSMHTVSQEQFHSKFGGVVPEIASRKHLNSIYEVTEIAIEKAMISETTGLDAVAVTCTPGLVGSLLVGINFAKGFALSLGIPLIAVNHLKAHAAACYIENLGLSPPFLCLIVSGGNTCIYDVKSFTNFNLVGSTRDDAAGEIFDKIARRMGIEYPGGPFLEKMASGGNELKFSFPIPKLKEFDFSFSGLKTYAINQVKNLKYSDFHDFSASLMFSVSKYLSDVLICAAEKLNRDQVAVAGGVASNSYLKKAINLECKKRNLKFHFPSKKYCGDNAAMIGVQGYYEFISGSKAELDLNVIR
ncbi:MAG: tRNA (adenosine(37)-N6)-threonylcarbamoyltransferase complex transferase subunit TsaD [Oscillospiraceae bacterium]|nr:tRNA (adenosine(37)-N6)-threonylcarbamoyltransferase complex transferase subunit TsaD [Oscillospiraceae bacterium]